MSGDTGNNSETKITVGQYSLEQGGDVFPTVQSEIHSEGTGPGSNSETQTVDQDSMGQDDNMISA